MRPWPGAVPTMHDGEQSGGAVVGFGQSLQRAERLVQLSSALGLGSPRTLEELRDRFGIYAGVETRAMPKKFERDRADLAEVGIHVETIRLGENHAYWIRRRTEPIQLSDEELDVLALLSATIGDPTTGVALATLAGDAGRFPADHADGRAAIDNLAIPDELTLALAQRHRLRATYRDATGTVAERSFEPVGAGNPIVGSCRDLVLVDEAVAAR